MGISIRNSQGTDSPKCTQAFAVRACAQIIVAGADLSSAAAKFVPGKASELSFLRGFSVCCGCGFELRLRLEYGDQNDVSDMNVRRRVGATPTYCPGSTFSVPHPAFVSYGHHIFPRVASEGVAVRSGVHAQMCVCMCVCVRGGTIATAVHYLKMFEGEPPGKSRLQEPPHAWAEKKKMSQ